MTRTRIEGVVNPDGSQGFAWNPFVGCSFEACSNRNCCWAMLCLKRSRCERCREFKPHWHPERIRQPYEVKKPSTFAVCWMGDLWRGGISTKDNPNALFPGKGLMLSVVADLQKHTFLFLTRNPKGYTPGLPPNVWLGITVTCQADVNRIGPDFASLDHPNKFISYEPILGEIKDWLKLGKFGWLYMGMLTKGKRDLSNETYACWGMDAQIIARKYGAKVWEKNSLGEELIKETPWLLRGAK